jgi:hypothetical protein
MPVLRRDADNNLLLRYASAMRSRIFWLGLLGLALLPPRASLAQQISTTSATFSVTDPSGAAIASAQVVVMIRSMMGVLKTDEHGHLSVNLPIGAQYGMRVSAVGYKSGTVSIDLTPAGGAATATKNVTVVLEREPDEYAIWSVLLTKKYATEGTKQLVIEDQTALLPSDLIVNDLARLENASDAMSDLKGKNQTPYPVENKFSVPVPCILISKETENGLFHFPVDNRIDAEAAKNIEKGWHQFYQDYPGAGGILTISRVGFSSDKSLAVVYISTKRSMMMANGKCYVFAKKNGSWEVEEEVLIWFS